MNSESLRSVNELIVLNLLREKQPISRSELAQITGLQESTISSITKSLIEEDLVYEADLADSSGGRKRRMLRIVDTRSVAVGVDLALPRTTVALSNFGGQIIAKTHFQTSLTPSRFTDQLIGALRSILRSTIISGTKIEGIGLSLPGLLDRAAGTIVYAADLGWRDVDIGSAIRREFELDVLFEDKVRTAGLAEIWFGNAADLENRHWISVVVAEGIGTAIIINGQLYGGSTLGAGQFGHVSLFPNGLRCCCGNRGCWEVYASDVATVARYLRHSKTKQMPKPSVSDIVRLAHQGDAVALQAITTTAKYLGMGMAMLVNGLNPESIILDGDIGLAWSLIEPTVWRVIRERALTSNYEHLRISPTKLTENASLLGAISLVLSRRFMLRKKSCKGMSPDLAVRY